MTVFDRDFAMEKQRLSVLLFGPPKVGKTRCVLDLVKKKQYVCLISTDHGTLEARRNPSLYKGKLVVSEVYTLNDIRKALSEGKDIVRHLIKAGVNPRDIWACIDTVTHLQILLLEEARRINLKHPETDNKDRDEYERDMTTQVDWGINLGLMSEVANVMNSYPCNIVYIGLEKEDKTTHRASVSMSGQSRDRFCGDVDLILRVARDGKGKKFQTSILDGAGDRSGVLNDFEEPDLVAVRDKIFGQQQTEQPTDSEDKKGQ